MISNYFKLFFRSFKKNTTPSMLSLVGLSIGIASSILMLFYIQHELSFDSFNKNHQNIYRIVFGTTDEEGSAFTAPILSTTIKESYPNVTAVTFNNAGNARVNFKVGEKQYMESSFLFTNAEVFSLFPFSLSDGNPKTCLADPFTIVVTRNSAQKFFGDVDPMGKTIAIDWNGRWIDLKITGVIDHLPENSHVKFEYLISMATAERIFEPQTFFTDWTANFCYSYLQIDDEQTKAQIERSITGLYKQNSRIETSSTTQLRLQPIDRIHLHSKLSGEFSQNTDVKYLYVAVTIGMLILLVSLFNYSNILTALFTKRLKEIRIRKVLGAKNSSVANQFIIESLVNIFMAIGVSFIWIALAAPFFTQLLGTSFNLLDVISQVSFLMLVFFLVLIGILTGYYPALLVNRQNAGDILYGKLKNIAKGTIVRNVFVGIQIFIALFIVIGALVVRKQLDFMDKKDLGFDKGSVLTIPQGRTIREKSEFVKNELAATGNVISSTLSSHLPSRGLSFKVPSLVEGGNPDGTNEPWPVAVVSVDYDFFTTYNLKLIEGRTFSSKFPSDSTQGYVINEAAAKALRWASPIGKEIQMTYNVGDGTVETRKGSVIGVIKDFHFESLHKQIEPMVFIFKPYWFYYLSLKLTKDVGPETIKQLQGKWETIVPNVPFEYSFMGERLEQLYTTEKSWGKSINIFSVIAICISCMGLFALVAFMVQNKMKEIAIRKIHGASSLAIALKLFTSVITLISIASILAIPTAWYFSNQWLSGFAYRTPINGSIFIFSVFLITLLSTSIVISQIMKAAKANPVKILKIE